MRPKYRAKGPPPMATVQFLAPVARFGWPGVPVGRAGPPGPGAGARDFLSALA